MYDIVNIIFIQMKIAYNIYSQPTYLQSRESLDSLLLTEGFALSGTIDISNKLSFGIGKISNEFVPIGLESFAMTTPT